MSTGPAPSMAESRGTAADHREARAEHADERVCIPAVAEQGEVARGEETGEPRGQHAGLAIVLADVPPDEGRNREEHDGVQHVVADRGPKIVIGMNISTAKLCAMSVDVGYPPSSHQFHPTTLPRSRSRTPLTADW